MKGLGTLDAAIQKGIDWIKDVMGEMNIDDPHKALLALRAVLHTLRNRLTVEEAAELSAQLPLVIRGLYFEGWNPSSTPVKDRHKDQFLSHIPPYFPNEPDLNPEEMVRAVFRVLAKRVSQGEIVELRSMFPPDLRDLWPEELLAVRK